MSAALDSVTIVGLGLIGGSIAAAVRRRMPSTRVCAVDIPDVISRPSAATLADRVVSVADTRGVNDAVADATLTILTTPVQTITRYLPGMLPVAKVLTDCGSTKREICDVAARLAERDRFVPGHPMAGSPRAGHQHADPELFVGRPWLLCSDVGHAEAHRLVSDLAVALGAVPASLSAAQHDRAVAITSHLPQILASLLLSAADEADALLAAGPGFESATRVAGGEEHMWRDIFETNRDELAAAASTLGTQLSGLAESLRAGSVEEVLRVLAAARNTRAP